MEFFLSHLYDKICFAAFLWKAVRLLNLDSNISSILKQTNSVKNLLLTILFTVYQVIYKKQWNHVTMVA